MNTEQMRDLIDDFAKWCADKYGKAPDGAPPQHERFASYFEAFAAGRRCAIYAAPQAPADVGEGDDFLLGVCVALQVVTAMDCNVTWREIVNTAGVEDLIRFATVIEPEEWELAGFSRYAKQELMRDKPDTAISTKAGGV